MNPAFIILAFVICITIWVSGYYIYSKLIDKYDKDYYEEKEKEDY